MRRLVLAVVVLVLLPVSGARAAVAPPLLAGVGQADITPPTGFAFGGWTRADRGGQGVHTRLEASAIVLQRGDRKFALVSVDLFAATGGLVKEAADRNADLGFSERNVLVSASHTHAGPSGFANFDTLNTLSPSMETIGTPTSFVELIRPKPTDRQLLRFLVDRLALAIREAATDLHPASVGWGAGRLTGVTENRSLEAHLADFGIEEPRGTGTPDQDPRGPDDTIDPDVDVLRVDRVVRRRRPCRRAGRPARCLRDVHVPIGAWTQFANHGTINPSDYQFYNQDHHGAATRVLEARIRATSKVPLARHVVAVYGNGNEGDMSAGLRDRGPEKAEEVGRKEADAFFAAWGEAGKAMTKRPDLDQRWTRICFCGQTTSTGRVAASPLPGIPFLTGSEEGRGPLFDVTGIPLEDRRSASDDETQGDKVGVPAASNDTVPQAVPLTILRIGDHAIASIPGEPTVEVGRRVKAAVLAAAGGAGIHRVVVAGLANEFVLYFTTPEEYQRQHYEGGSTVFGRNSSTLLIDQLGVLAKDMASGAAAPDPYPFDPRHGVVGDGAPYPDGADQGSFIDQPAPAGAEVTWRWQGGPRGFDRPLDTPFLTIERRDGTTWRRETDDLGLRIRWKVDADGRYTGEWLVPAQTAPGTFRVVVTARRYRLESEPFQR